MPVPKGSTRKHKPIELKISSGTVENYRVKHEPKRLRPSTPDAPAYLSEAQKQSWDRFAYVLGPTRMRVLTDDDAEALEMLACAYDDMRKVRASLRERGDKVMVEETTHRKDGSELTRTVPAPEFRVLQLIDAKLLGLLGRFGLTPADRGRVRDLGLDEEAAHNPDEEFASFS